MNPLTLIGGLRGIAVALCAAIATFALVATYDRLWAYPKIANDARLGFVVLAEKTALEAKLAEVQRQTQARAQANTESTKRQAALRAALATKSQQIEMEIAGYEAKLLDTRRLCGLDGADIEFLRNASGAAKGGIK